MELSAGVKESEVSIECEKVALEMALEGWSDFKQEKMGRKGKSKRDFEGVPL